MRSHISIAGCDVPAFCRARRRRDSKTTQRIKTVYLGVGSRSSPSCSLGRQTGSMVPGWQRPSPLGAPSSRSRSLLSSPSPAFCSPSLTFAHSRLRSLEHSRYLLLYYRNLRMHEHDPTRWTSTRIMLRFFLVKDVTFPCTDKFCG